MQAVGWPASCNPSRSTELSSRTQSLIELWFKIVCGQCMFSCLSFSIITISDTLVLLVQMSAVAKSQRYDIDIYASIYLNNLQN